ncbi:STAS domain-containing protein [Couchioplanes caeruleus]|uniref:Anti-sigma factor antagonist n=2 Tax=Couchioplanes caeruleus TaxID=56438 RepID=A0A1K0FYQ9_9ACTN|nr:STAS domain-containing protein [Couchioplanes caeruleus]OJF10186.1 hypothetical protein BG844_33425 [Couchioplanes caeruleus subsp. caeruleus]ROP28819.1 anti-anti-sigma factor [Couchioplanes caeruleus]
MTDTEPWAGPSAPPPPASVTVVGTTDALTIAVAGELDAANRVAVHDALHDAIAARSPRHVVIDLAGLSFCDTAGIRVLAGILRQLTVDGTTCHVRKPQPHVARLLRLIPTDAVVVP